MNLNEIRNVFGRQYPTNENPKEGNNNLLVIGIILVIGLSAIVYTTSIQKEYEERMRRKV